MKEWQNRVVEEKWALDIKLDALSRCMDSVAIKAMSGDDIDLLHWQREVMIEYSLILQMRVDSFVETKKEEY